MKMGLLVFGFQIKEGVNLSSPLVCPLGGAAGGGYSQVIPMEEVKQSRA